MANYVIVIVESEAVEAQDILLLKGILITCAKGYGILFPSMKVSGCRAATSRKLLTWTVEIQKHLEPEAAGLVL